MVNQSTFLGYFRLGETVHGIEQAVNSSIVPTAAGAAPTFRVYGPDGTNIAGANGTSAAFDSGNVTAAYRFSFTATDPEFVRGQMHSVCLSYTVGGAARQSWFTFMVT